MISPEATITTSQSSSSSTYQFYGLAPPITQNLADSSTAVAQVVPIQPVPSQTLSVALGAQQCTIDVYGKRFSVPVHPPGTIATDPPTLVEVEVVFVDLYVADVLVIGGCLARSGVGVVQNTYFDFVGEVAIEDVQPDPVAGPSDPFISGLGTRFVLSYWSDA